MWNFSRRFSKPVGFLYSKFTKLTGLFDARKIRWYEYTEPNGWEKPRWEGTLVGLILMSPEVD